MTITGAIARRCSCVAARQRRPIETSTPEKSAIVSSSRAGLIKLLTIAGSLAGTMNALAGQSVMHAAHGCRADRR